MSVVRYKQAPRIPARKVGGIMAVITPRNAEIHRFNEVAERIWELCASDEGVTEDTLVTLLLAEYEVEEAVLRADVAAFLHEAVAKSLLVAS